MRDFRHNFFHPVGAHVLVDGQFGSTGKGVLAAYLARQAYECGIQFRAVISNAGPNSGHTFYHGDEKIVLKQLPTFAVAMAKMGLVLPIYLSAGAIIDPVILAKEANDYPGPIIIHTNAAVITAEDKAAEHSGTIAAVAGTRSGTGAALARKVLRDPGAVAKNALLDIPPNVFVTSRSDSIKWNTDRYFVEVSQGFSLGINQRFYPKCTSRECTVSQALSDAGIPPNGHSKTYMSIRTFPIRVGNVDGYTSGEWYVDQEETSWEEIGVDPELTTVTQRVRRVATFSAQQFKDALAANSPDYVFANFMNYLDEGSQAYFANRLRAYQSEAPIAYSALAGYGPRSEDVKWLF